jgi:signal transduction histidine kinase
MNQIGNTLISKPESRAYKHIAQHNWRSHPLGEISVWCKPLLQSINCALANKNPMLVLWGNDLLQFYNDPYHTLFGNTDHAIGESALNDGCCSWTDLKEVSKRVFSGQVYCQQLVTAKLPGKSQSISQYHFNFSPIWGEDGHVAGILACGHQDEIDHQSQTFKIQHHCQEHMAMAILSGPGFQIDFMSKKMMAYLGIGDNAIGKELVTVVPWIEDMDSFEQFALIHEHKRQVHAFDLVISITQDNQTVKKHIDICFDPCIDDDGLVSDIILTASDVSYKVAAQKTIRQKESERYDYTQRLEIALQAGNLGCYELFLASGKMNCTDQCKANFGLLPNYEFSYEGLMACILEDDRAQMQAAVAEALSNRADYHAQYRVKWPDQSVHWIWASGRALYNAQGKPVKMVGVTRQITQQKNREQELEELVALRTRELSRANRQLKDENLEVSASVRELSKSNASLEGFAYTASHDLQEPLRKMQTYGSLLKGRLAERIDPESIRLIDRMQAAGVRMSELISGLLDLSRLSAERSAAAVNLNEAVQAAMDALELKVAETSAIIQVDNLGIVQGDLSQLIQVFQNLIGNSLRFVFPGRRPVLRISASIIRQSDIRQYDLPSPVASSYRQITISDNGIGFAQENAGQIFEIFKRLHGRGTYEGTGLGLSICKQVVESHKGIIYASGQQGDGATFTILLPIEQHV